MSETFVPFFSTSNNWFMQSKLVKQNKFCQQKTVCEIENKTNKMNFDLTLQKKKQIFFSAFQQMKPK